MSFQFFMPTRLLIGAGSLEKLHEQALPGKKALIVISAGKSIKSNGYLDRVEHELDLAGVEYSVFDKILPNPIKEHVMEGAALARAEGCDFVIGLGGGSSIDSAKAIAIMATNSGDYWDYLSGGTGKGQPIPNAPLKIVAITTTAGTGTEADPWTVITKTETNEKIGTGYDLTFPVLSIVDADLMKTVPPHLTAFQGFDALFHSVEGYLATIANPVSDVLALKSIELAARSLPTAVKDGNDIGAREDLALANTLAGIVESVSGCISEHSLAHAMSGITPELPHGAALIAISRAYFQRYVDIHACDDRFIAIAKVMGKPNADKASDFIDALTDLQKACGVDNIKLSDYNFDGEHPEKYVDNAIDTMGGLFNVDPVRMTAEECIKVLKDSYR